ncbi:TPA: FMN-binding negative transcriptional regulator [Staphylococcus aureus]|uniref:FMN-binding negative transcriptional regulator n=1 Tax=Staphylococcus aureus TaxID=1280 RepID=UPI0002423CE9|nr:FMN-binding negative transcriptional regulator [Staphylococcus aureus]ALH99347.1 protease [Staphylococcus aureus]EHM56322.1 protease synthase and sporulation protein PAI 2 [Staphylococcus aureus subsp. aureus 21202]MBO8773778.1 FMN-binding negative transcriptional regulator [Staphylococcus aureus]MCS4889289.1 FMN-binding negative transcriptional regulator [Staphylococcus aureus]NFY05076.1 FMN-binding negative transcriptional regulator [Staphylococcus aureus]
MYIPKFFQVNDFKEIEQFIQSNSFGMIVTEDQGKPLATHLPLIFQKNGADYYISGHIAKGNPQWKTLNGNGNVLIIYQGAHAYVSSSWYEKENVPTWNYQAVHLYGEATVLNEQETIDGLKTLLTKYEQNRENPVLWDNLAENTQMQAKAIVGFKVKIKKIEAAYKMSQNRNEQDYNNIIKNLEDEHNSSSKAVADVMKEIYPYL